MDEVADRGRIRGAKLEAWLRAAIDSGDEQAVSDLLLDAKAPLHLRCQAGAALANGREEVSARALRMVLEAPVPHSDITCTALRAIGKRLGAEATEDVAPLLDSRSAGIRAYAFITESFFGGLRVMPRMVAEWEKIIRASRRRQPNSTIDVLRYFARHFDSLDEHVRQQIAELGRQLWERAHPGPKDWMETYWPSLVASDTGDIRPSALLIHETIEDWESGVNAPRLEL